ncbi:Platinum sensitivity protein [Tulasnella sp. JGI-2019a]|nr:Platinum sensitivity protein [Tulasnella sp. JGI-2019a]
MASPQSDLAPSPSTTAKDDKDDLQGQDRTDGEQRRSSSPAPGPPTPLLAGSSLDGNVHSSSPAQAMARSSSPPFSPSPPAVSPSASPPHDPSPEPEGAKTPTKLKDAANRSRQRDTPTAAVSAHASETNRASSSKSTDTTPPSSPSVDKNSDAAPRSPSEDTTSRPRRKRKRSGVVVESEVDKGVADVTDPGKADAVSSSPSKSESNHGEEDGHGEDLDMEEVNQDMVNGQASHPREGSSSTAETLDSSHSDADGETFSDEWMADMRRVKVYELVGQRWTDRGTALCTGVYDDEAEQASIVARSEVSDIELLRSEIRAEDVYQRQQETLIVWTEPDGTDYALSFQDLEGCAEIWDFILEVQKHFRGKNDPNNLLNGGVGPNGSVGGGGVVGGGGPSSSPLSHRGVGGQRPISANTIVQAGRLPEPTLGIISEIDKAIKFIGRTSQGREKICEYLVREDYIKQLIETFARAEDLEALSDLHALCSLMQTILTMNDHPVYDYILQDDVWMGVLGMLEYDPDFPTFKASFRDYLTQSTQYKEVVVFKDESIRKKIHQTYRLQFLKDVVLARVLDDPTFNVLNSFILFNQIDIINHIQHDETLLPDLFANYAKKDDEVEVGVNGAGKSSKASEDEKGKGKAKAISDLPSDGTEHKKRDIIILIHQLCIMGKNVQIPARLALYRCLVDKGLLPALSWALLRYAHAHLDAEGGRDVQVLNAAAEILIIVSEHDANGVRIVALKQADPNGEWDKQRPRTDSGNSSGSGSSGATVVTNSPLMGMGGMEGMGVGQGGGTPYGPDGKWMLQSDVPTVVTAIVKVLTTAKDVALRAQMAEALRLLLEVPTMDEPPPNMKVTPPKGLPQREDLTTERFLSYFYDSCIGTMYKPLMDVPQCNAITTPMYEMSRDTATLFLYLCDNLSNWVTHHGHRSQFFLLTSCIAKRVATLLKAREKYVRLAALRFFRICLRTNNNFVIRHFTKNELFGPVVDLTMREGKRDNLVSSACQEFFEGIRKENHRLLITHIFEKYEAQIRELCKPGPVAEMFRGLLLRWEQNNEPLFSAGSQKRLMPLQNGRNPHLGRPGMNNMGGSDPNEEHYFDTEGDDEEDPIGPMPAVGDGLASPPLAVQHGAHAGGVPLRRRESSRGAERQMPGAIALPKLPVGMSLVDYGNDEDDGEGSGNEHEDGTRTPPEGGADLDGNEGVLSPGSSSGGDGGGGLKKTTSFSDLRVYTNGVAPSSPERKPNVNGDHNSLMGLGSPPRLSEKRRRDDDDEEAFGRLAAASSSNKGSQKKVMEVKLAGNNSKATAKAVSATTSGSLSPAAGPTAKRIKLSLGNKKFGTAQSTSDTASAAGTEDAPSTPPAGSADVKEEVKLESEGGG